MTPHSASPTATTYRSPTRRSKRWTRFASLVAAPALMLLAVTGSADASSQDNRPASIGPGVNQHGVGPTSVTDALRCARPAHYVHFKKHRAVIAVAVGMAESNCVASATGHNGPTGGCPNGSDDRGLWQINSCYHSEVSDKCAYRARCNARATKHISDRGKNWSPWSAYNSGAYKQFLPDAKDAVHQVYDGSTAQAPLTQRR